MIVKIENNVIGYTYYYDNINQISYSKELHQKNCDCPTCAITRQEIKKLTAERLPVFKFQLISDTEEQIVELGLSNMVYLLNNQGKTVDRIPVYIPDTIE